MATTASKLACPAFFNDPRHAFDRALAQIRQDGQQLTSYRTPIAVRGRSVTVPGDQTNEKRALNDAARALAQLWNVSRTRLR